MNPIDIRALRRGLKFTQARLGILVGVHGCTIGSWERGVQKPRPQHIECLQQLDAQAQSVFRGEASGARALTAPAERHATASEKPPRTLRRRKRIARAVAHLKAANPARFQPATPNASGARWDLYHGDLFDVLPTLSPDSFDALIVDLPYSSGGLHIGTKQQNPRRKYQGHSVQIRRQDFDGDMRDQLAFGEWSTDVLRRSYRLIKRGGVFAAFIDFRQIVPLILAAQRAGFVLRGIAVWDKTEAARPVPGRPRNQCEFVLWGSKGELRANRGVPILPGVFREPVRKHDKHHLTGKPTAVMRWLAKFVTPGGRVLDPCAGSGSTGVGALLEGRSFTGIEQDFYYAQVAAARLKAAEQGQVIAVAQTHALAETAGAA